MHACCGGARVSGFRARSSASGHGPVVLERAIARAIVTLCARSRTFAALGFLGMDGVSGSSPSVLAGGVRQFGVILASRRDFMMSVGFVLVVLLGFRSVLF